MYTAKWSLNRLNIDDVYTASLILGFEHMKVFTNMRILLVLKSALDCF